MFTSIVHTWHSSQLGAVGPYLAHSGQAPLRNCLKQRFVEEAPRWNVHKTMSPFNRRVMAIEWHPVYHNAVAFGSHGGSVYLWSFEDSERDRFIQGLGYGAGCITAMKFHPENPNLLYTAALDGRFCLQDFEGRKSSVFLDTQDLAFWWCSADFSRAYNTIFVGDNTGKAVILDSAGQVVCKYQRLHKGKIKYAEFCPGRHWLFATASADHTVALWDIRMLREQSGDILHRPEPLSVLEHGAPINSAVFDPHYGSRLLTTAQNSELRVYDACNNWEVPTIICTHPHRHYQHMTDIMANWHPVHNDLCVVGRYPAKVAVDQSRCVDLIDTSCGECVGYLYSPSLKGVIVLNKFNKFGTFLASGMGYHCLIWQPLQEVLDRVRGRVRAERISNGLASSSSLPGSTSQRRPRGSKRKRERGESDEEVTKKKIRKLNAANNKKKDM